MNEPIERMLPHNLDAERAILGAILTRDEALLDVTGLVTAADFYRLAHQRIFAAAQALAAKDTAVDLVTVKEYLASQGQLDEIGGPAYLASVTQGVPRSSNVPHHAGIVREKARLRALISGASRVLAEAYEADEDAKTVLDRAEQALFELGQSVQVRGGFKHLADMLPGVMQSIENWSNTPSGVSGVASGFDDLDLMTSGFQPGNFVIVAGRPSMGKSSLMINIAMHVARAQTVGIFSLEMSELDLALRALTAEMRIDGHRLKRGRLYGNEWGRLTFALERLAELKMYIDPSPYLTPFEMRSRSRRLKAEHGLDLLIVDYAQLMDPDATGRKDNNRTVELTGITRALKGLARDLDIPVIALSQLSRDLEKRPNKRPMLSDLRESGSLEQDADVVIFIYRESVYGETEENRGIAEFIIGKQRNGPTGTVRVSWNPELTQFGNLVHQAIERMLPMGEQ